jgi:hypothetical protein
MRSAWRQRLSDEEGPLAVRVVDDRWTTVRQVVESLAIVAAGLWAFYVFVYAEKIKPASDPASLTQTVSVRRLGRDSSRDVLSIDIRLENSGKTEIDVAADAYNVWGERYGTRDARADKRSATQRQYGRSIPVLSQTLIRAFAELRDAAVGGRTGTHIIIESGSTEAISYVVVVPRGKYDVIRAQTIDVPMKTGLARKAAVAITGDRVRGLGLNPAADSGAQEDDIDTYFALIP